MDESLAQSPRPDLPVEPRPDLPVEPRPDLPVDLVESDEASLARTAGRYQIQLFVDRSGAGINWRLLAANHREFGRGVTLFTDRFACRAALEAIRAEPERMVARSRRAAMGRWTWELSFDGAPIARSSRVFDRLIRCEQVSQALVSNFSQATISDVVVDMSGRAALSESSMRLRERP